MSPVDIAVRCVVVPAAVAVVAAVLARWLGRGRGTPVLADLIVAAGLAGGFLLSTFLQGSDVGWWPAATDDGWKGSIVVARLGFVLACVTPFVRLPTGPALALRWLAGAGAAWIVLHRLSPHAVSAAGLWIRAAGWGCGAALLWTALEGVARRDARVRRVLPALLALGATAFLLLEAGRSLVMSTAAAGLASATAATALFAPWRGGPALPATCLPVLVLGFVSLLAGAHGYLNYGDVVRFPLVGAASLVLAAACVAVPRSRWALALAAVLVGVAVLTSIRFDEPLAY